MPTPDEALALVDRSGGDRDSDSTSRNRGTAEADRALLAEVDRWRIDLACNVALRNHGVSQRDLNFVVQRTIEGIVFLRICEDRGIESSGQLQTLASGTEVYTRLCELFRQAEKRYHLGLLHFARKKDRGDPHDELCLSLQVDDRVLQQILGRLDDPDRPLDFSALADDILGQMYEQFLGAEIRLTEDHQVVVEGEPSVKKAGGVFYTPPYLVDYIVERTVGQLLKGKTAHDVAARTPTWRPSKRGRPLAVLDPACGSGSFLIGAYQFLVDWYRDWYLENDPAAHEDRVYETRNGQWRLTIAERQRVLADHLYGVDIDPQAVEVTKRSLLLKVFEGESQGSLQRQTGRSRVAALPDLANNIQCGNSLIDSDFGEAIVSLREVSPFREAKGDHHSGFDAVIGNPPWLMPGYYGGSELDCLRGRFRTATGKFDLYYLFIELGIRLLSRDGIFGMLVPNKFFHTRAAQPLRSLLSSGQHIHQLVDFGYEKLFRGATNYSCMVFLRPQPAEAVAFLRSDARLATVESFQVPWRDLNDRGWHFLPPGKQALFEKMRTVGVPLERLVDRFGTGVQSGADRLLVLDGSQVERLRLEPDALCPVLRGRDVRRYAVSPVTKRLVFPYREEEDRFVICDESSLMRTWPMAHAYLVENKKQLADRVWFGKNAEQLSGQWFGMMYLDACWAFRRPHLLTPSLSDRANFAVGDGRLFVTGTAGITSIIPDSDKIDIFYLLAVLNSSLMSCYAVHHSPVFQGGYSKFSAPYLKELPIPVPEDRQGREGGSTEQIAQLAREQLVRHQRLQPTRTRHERNALTRQIRTSDHRIDQLVCELYGLTAEEIQIVEEAQASRSSDPP